MLDALQPWLQPWWPDLASFLQMGRHGRYVWGGVAVCALALVIEGLLLRRRARRAGRSDAA